MAGNEPKDLNKITQFWQELNKGPKQDYIILAGNEPKDLNKIT